MNRPAVPVVLLAVLILLPAASADTNRDGDPLSDDAEGLVCGFPDVREALEALDGRAGTCDGFDYTHPHLGNGSRCDDGACRARLVRADTVDATPDVDVDSRPLPPASVPSFGPFVVPGQQADVVTLEGYRGPADEYCLRVVLEGPGFEPPPLCAAVGPLQDVLPPVGPVTLVRTPRQEVGPTPGVDEGELGSSPAVHQGNTTVTVDVTAHWVEDRLKRRASFGQFEAWEPVDLLDPDDVGWWVDHGASTRLDVHVAWHDEDGSALAERSHALPHLGQAFAAAARSP